VELMQVSRWRNLAGKAASCFFLLAFVTLLDGLVAHFREPSNLFRVLPGAVTEINGYLPGEVKGVEDLTYVSTSPRLKVTLNEVHKGYFMGAPMWQGMVEIDAQIEPGEYRVVVKPRSLSFKGPAPIFHILVYANPLSLQQASPSFIRRFTGLSPFGLAASFLPGIILAAAAVYYLSGKRENLLAQEGKAEIYQVVKGDGLYEVRFSLGTSHGIGPGSQLQIFDNLGETVGTAQVEESNPKNSLALVTTDREVRVGYLVCR
jgi:hypothetical protein